MSVTVVLCFCCGLLLAADPDAGPVAGPGDPVPGRADITITVLNELTVTLGGNPRGCDYADTYGELFVTDFNSDLIYSLNPNTGSVNGTLACPSGVPDVLGIAIQQAPSTNYIYINNWNAVTDVYRYDVVAALWTSFTNPVTGEPRGMDMDDDDMLWCIDASTRLLYRFNTSGGGVTSWSLTQLPASFACACAVFPYNGNLGVLVGGYAYGNFYIYEYDGSGLYYIGSVAEPSTASSSYDVTYSADRDSFFWVWKQGSAFKITEFEMDVQTALSRDTWAGIKASF